VKWLCSGESQDSPPVASKNLHCFSTTGFGVWGANYSRYWVVGCGESELQCRDLLIGWVARYLFGADNGFMLEISQ
jgi:hypothetical protein